MSTTRLPLSPRVWLVCIALAAATAVLCTAAVWLANMWKPGTATVRSEEAISELDRETRSLVVQDMSIRRGTSLEELKSLETLHFWGCTLESDVPFVLSSLPSLKNLSFRGCTFLSADWVSALGSTTSVRSVEIDRCQGVSATTVTRLLSSGALDVVAIYDSGVPDLFATKSNGELGRTRSSRD